jgi:hypothetical protein
MRPAYGHAVPPREPRPRIDRLVQQAIGAASGMTDRKGGVAAGWMVVSGLALILWLHFAEPAFPITWGYAHLGRLPLLPWLAAAVVLALPPAVARALDAPSMREPLSPWPWTRIVAASAAVLVLLLAASLRAPAKPVSIDPPLFVIGVGRGDVNARAMLATWTLGRLVAACRGISSGTTTLLVSTALTGTVTVTALVASARRLARTRAEAFVTASLACTAFGTVAMLFGVTDVYPSALALVALFFWTALRALDGDGHPAWPFVIGAVAPFWYMGLLLLAPSLLVVLIEAARARRWRAIGVALGLAIVAAGVATIPLDGRPFDWLAFLEATRRASSVELGASPTSSLLPLSWMLTWHHVGVVLNTWLLVDGVGMLLVGTLGVADLARHVVAWTWDAKGALLWATVAGWIAFTATMDRLLGGLPEWDMFSTGAVPVSLLGGYVLVRWGRERPQWLRWLAGVAVATAIVHLLARLDAQDVDLLRHLIESPPTVQP